MSPHELEARLNAHREILISLMASMMENESNARLFESLEQDAQFRNGEEDPGVLTSEAFATEAQAADEIGRVLDAARARARAR